MLDSMFDDVKRMDKRQFLYQVQNFVLLQINICIVLACLQIILIRFCRSV